MSFPDQKDISQSHKFGCFFSSPQAAVPFQPRVHVCAYAIWRKFFEEASDFAKKQYGYDSYFPPAVSKRAGLLIIFLLKEGNYLTAYMVWGLLWLGISAIKLLLAVLLSPMLLLLHRSPRNWRQIKQVHAGIDGAIHDHLAVVFTMCVNFSTVYRMSLNIWAIKRNLVNASIRVRRSTPHIAYMHACASLEPNPDIRSLGF